MNCNDCQANFTQYSAGQLTTSQIQAMTAHLDACKQCSTALAQTTQLFDLLDRQEQPSVLLQSRFSARLAQTQIQPEPATERWFQRLWPTRPVWACAYSLLLVFSGALGGQMLPDGAGAAQNADQDSIGNNPALVCPVQSSPWQWLPANEHV